MPLIIDVEWGFNAWRRLINLGEVRIQKRLARATNGDVDSG
jgi:hypothetical protein